MNNFWNGFEKQAGMMTNAFHAIGRNPIKSGVGALAGIAVADKIHQKVTGKKSKPVDPSQVMAYHAGTVSGMASRPMYPSGVSGFNPSRGY